MSWGSQALQTRPYASHWEMRLENKTLQTRPHASHWEMRLENKTLLTRPYKMGVERETKQKPREQAVK